MRKNYKKRANLNNTSGEITSRDLLVVGAITIIAAVVIVVLFITLSGKKEVKDQDGQTQQLIDQIRDQAARDAQVDIDDGKTGQLFEVGNSAELKSKLEDLISDSQKRSRMGEAGRRKALENYEIKAHAKKIMKIYRSLA